MSTLSVQEIIGVTNFYSPQLNAAFSTANSANVVAVTAFDKANTALANTSGVTFAGDLTISGSVNSRSGIVSTANNTVGAAGQALLSTGTGTYWAPVSGTAPTTQVFTSSGTWNRPTGCKFVKVTLIGAGGGGGGGRMLSTCASCVPGIGGFGGVGGLSINWLDVTSISSATVTIGAGGAGSTGTGSTGGTTSFGSYAQSTGGAGGVASTGGAGAAGAGGTASLGTINVNGPSGPSGSTSIVVNGQLFGGLGTYLSSLTGTFNNGVAGAGYGAPGSGGYNSSTVTYRAGANGASGLIIVEEFY